MDEQGNKADERSRSYHDGLSEEMGGQGNEAMNNRDLIVKA